MNETRKEITEKDVFLEKHLKEVKMKWGILSTSIYFNRMRRILVSKIHEGRADMGIDCIITCVQNRHNTDL